MDTQQYGESAQRVNDEPAFQMAMERVEAGLVKRLRECEFDGSEENERYREKLTLMLQVQGHYKRVLLQMINSGKLKEASLNKKTFTNRRGL